MFWLPYSFIIEVGIILEVIILLQAVLIIIMQLVIVPLTTLRTIFVVKGEIRTASILGGLEALIMSSV